MVNCIIFSFTVSCNKSRVSIVPTVPIVPIDGWQRVLLFVNHTSMSEIQVRCMYWWFLSWWLDSDDCLYEECYCVRLNVAVCDCVLLCMSVFNCKCPVTIALFSPQLSLSAQTGLQSFSLMRLTDTKCSNSERLQQKNYAICQNTRNFLIHITRFVLIYRMTAFSN